MGITSISGWIKVVVFPVATSPDSLPAQIAALVPPGRNGWTRKVPMRKPMLMKKWSALMNGRLLFGPRAKTRRTLSAVRKIP